MCVCRICCNDYQNKKHLVREMMVGTRETFEYFQCGKCGCLQILSIPENMEKYYPPNYYSFNSKAISGLQQNRLKSFLIRQRSMHYLGKKNIIGMLLAQRSVKAHFFNWLIGRGIGINSRILDVGCGDGGLLRMMRKEGFNGGVGVDFYIEKDLAYPDGLKIFKKTVFELQQQFDFIMLHHSFEHMPDPVSVMRKIFELLAPGCFLLLRIPVVSSYAWRKYGVDWVQIDAPRHFYLHTPESIGIVAEKSGFAVNHIEYDSTEFQFWGSEQYRQNIPLFDPRSCLVSTSGTIFSEEQIEEFKKQTRVLNKKAEGDSAVFYLQKRLVLP